MLPSRVFWRGSSTGGHPMKDNWRRMHRLRMMAIAKTRPDLFDVGMTGFIQCEQDACDEMRAEIGQVTPTPENESRKYKYAIDIDGNTFSQRYLRLLMSGALVFKATVFNEFHDDWLVPYKHFIPVQPDLSDLVERIEWAVAHDDHARRIAETGRRFVRDHITSEQMECYIELALIELADALGMDK
ncbi:hypothetical protein HK105_203792 [Polyrhizophydium stewartii]|uniref:Glycosyl transferase CAP10 domain-containing protein n=1 Tax=Polyrhizophydium stewartii TaxID=2732419 RepID=A0ABR4NAX4_9FUNG